MITIVQARGLVLHYLGKLEAESRRLKDLRKGLSTDERDLLGLADEDEILRLAIVEEETIERDFGWVFFWETAQYLENRDDSYALVGNSPLLIARQDGSLHELGTAEPVEHYIETFERFGDPHGDKSSAVPEPLASTYEMISNAYPQGLPVSDYWPLLCVLRRSGMSFRSIADIMHLLRFAEWRTAYHDAMGLEDTTVKIPEIDHVSVVKKLRAFGYDKWLLAEK